MLLKCDSVVKVYFFNVVLLIHLLDPVFLYAGTIVVILSPAVNRITIAAAIYWVLVWLQFLTISV